MPAAARTRQVCKSTVCSRWVVAPKVLVLGCHWDGPAPCCLLSHTTLSLSLSALALFCYPCFMRFYPFLAFCLFLLCSPSLLMRQCVSGIKIGMKDPTVLGTTSEPLCGGLPGRCKPRATFPALIHIPSHSAVSGGGHLHDSRRAELFQSNYLWTTCIFCNGPQAPPKGIKS